MASERGMVMLVFLALLPCLASGSPVPADFSLSAGRQEGGCPPDWHRFRHLCWTLVPEALTLTFLANDVTSADALCRGEGARAFHVAGRLYCVKEAVRLDDDLRLENLFESDGKFIRKRIMGNNGY